MSRYRTTRKPKTPPKQRSLAWLLIPLAGLVLLLGAGLILRNNSAQPKGNIEGKGSPRIKVDQQVIDHGEVKLGNPVRDVVRVTNTGDQTLTFTEPPTIEVLEGC